MKVKKWERGEEQLLLDTVKTEKAKGASNGNAIKVAAKQIGRPVPGVHAKYYDLIKNKVAKKVVARIAKKISTAKSNAWDDRQVVSMFEAISAADNKMKTAKRLARSLKKTPTAIMAKYYEVKKTGGISTATTNARNVKSTKMAGIQFLFEGAKITKQGNGILVECARPIKDVHVTGENNILINLS